MKEHIIVASCKKWHFQEFLVLKGEIKNFEWVWISDDKELVRVTSEIKPKYIFFLHWSQIVPESIYSRFECVCFHMSDLPYGQGGSPLQNLILLGHKETQLSALRMEKGIDTGPIYTKRYLSLVGTAQEIYERAGLLSFEIIRWILEHNPTPYQQEGSAVIFKRRKPEQSMLPVHGSCELIYDFIRMLDAETYPLAFIEHGDFILKFKGAKIKGDKVDACVEISLRKKDERF